MSARPTEPRIPPLAPEHYDERVASLLARLASPSGDLLNIYTTLARHPALFRRWIGFGALFFAGTLPPRERELVILRTGWLCRSEYEWGQHVLIARAAGLADEEIERVRSGPGDPGWSSHEAALLAAVDELHDDACISEHTWVALREAFDEPQLIELVMLIGQYHLISFVLNSLGVEREEGVPGF